MGKQKINPIIRLISAFAIVITSVAIAGFFAVLVHNNSVYDVASRNAIVTFAIITIPLLYIGFKFSQYLMTQRS